MLSVDRIKELIRETGRDPVERDTIYRAIHRDESDFRKWTTGAELAAAN